MVVLIWPLIIVGGIIFLISRWRAKHREREWYLRLSLSKEDALSQWFGLLAFLFLALAMFGLNREMGEWLSWQTVLGLVVLIGLVAAYGMKMRYVLIFSLGGVLVWWSAQVVKWTQSQQLQEISAVSGLILIGLWLFMLSRWQARQEVLKRLSLIYLVWSLVVVTGWLFYFSTRVGLMTLQGISKGNSFLSFLPLTLMWGVLFIGLWLGLGYSWYKKILAWYEAVGAGVLAALFGIITFLPPQVMFINGQFGWGYLSDSGQLTAEGLSWAVVFNVLIFVELVAIIFLGYLRREKWLVDFGAVILFLLVIVKYFDWFFSFLDKSLFFIGAGFLLLIVGWLMERGRRYVLAEINSQNN